MFRKNKYKNNRNNILRMLLKRIFIFGSLLFHSVLTWGPIGHSTIAEIAQQLISPSTNEVIKPILKKYDGNMSQAANWADQVRILPEFKWSEPVHFINTPDWNCSYVRERDCFNDQKQYGFCVDGAIQNYTYILHTRTCKTDPTLIEDALKFMIHFYGDIHQPLHCGFSSDRGGNTIKGHYFKKSTNLHAIWDSEIIETRISSDFGGNVWRWQQFLLEQIPKTWLGWKPDSELWGEDSVSLACKYSYVQSDGITKIAQDFELGDSYYFRNIKIIEKQIIKAAVRLKNDLDVIFG